MNLSVDIFRQLEVMSSVHSAGPGRHLLLRWNGPTGNQPVVLSVQALRELFNVLVKKAKRPAVAARTAMLTWRDAYPLSDTSSTVMINAADLAADHHLGIWDSVIMAATAEAGCRLLLSEDLHEGFTWRGVTVTNPFAHPHHALLDVLLGERNT